MLQWAWLLAAHGDVMHRYAATDGELYCAAFALAGKDADFRQLPFLPRLALGAYDRHQQGLQVLPPAKAAERTRGSLYTTSIR